MTLRISRFDQAVPLVDAATGKLTQEGLRRLNKALEQIEGAVNTLATTLGLVIDLNDLITTVETAAENANTAAASAEAAAEASASASALANSWVTGLTISAADVGANVTVTLSAHTRHYPQANGTTTTVSVNGGTVTGLAYSTDYWIYYDDAARTGGAVTYAATTSPATAAQTGNRHAVGAVTTPAAAAPPSDGNVVRPPGYVEP